MADQRALLVLDMVNEIVHPDGKFAALGWAAQVAERDVIAKTAAAIGQARSASVPVIYVAVGFSPGYPEWPALSPVFGGAKEYQALELGSWGTAIHAAIAPREGERVVIKHRVSPFFGTPLDVLLRTMGVSELLLGGVATDFVVLAAARDGHDRDFRIVVLEDCCAAADPAVHEAAVTLLKGTAEVADSTAALG